MKRDITPFYLETPYETLTGSGTVYPSGDTSFVIISDLTGNMTIDLPIRNSNHKPIKPGTCIRFFRTDNTAFSCGLATTKLNPGSTFYDNGIEIDLIVKSGESCTAMMMGPTETNKQGEWALIDSDLAGSDSWNGGTITNPAIFSNSATFNANVNIGNGPADLATIDASLMFSDSNTRPNLIAATASDGNVSFGSDRASNNVGQITFSGDWAENDTFTFALQNIAKPSSYNTTNKSYYTFLDKDSTVNGHVSSSSDAGFTFTASGTCEGTLRYLFLAVSI